MRVNEFIENRLTHYSVSYEFCLDWTEVELRVREIILRPPEDTEFLVLLDAMNPITDFEVIKKMSVIQDSHQLTYL